MREPIGVHQLRVEPRSAADRFRFAATLARSSLAHLDRRAASRRLVQLAAVANQRPETANAGPPGEETLQAKFDGRPVQGKFVGGKGARLTEMTPEALGAPGGPYAQYHGPLSEAEIEIKIEEENLGSANGVTRKRPPTIAMTSKVWSALEERMKTAGKQPSPPSPEQVSAIATAGHEFTHAYRSFLQEEKIDVVSTKGEFESIFEHKRAQEVVRTLQEEILGFARGSAQAGLLNPDLYKKHTKELESERLHLWLTAAPGDLAYEILHPGSKLELALNLWGYVESTIKSYTVMYKSGLKLDQSQIKEAAGEICANLGSQVAGFIADAQAQVRQWLKVAPKAEKEPDKKADDVPKKEPEGPASDKSAGPAGEEAGQ